MVTTRKSSPIGIAPSHSRPAHERKGRTVKTAPRNRNAPRGDPDRNRNLKWLLEHGATRDEAHELFKRPSVKLSVSAAKLAIALVCHHSETEIDSKAIRLAKMSLVGAVVLEDPLASMEALAELRGLDGETIWVPPSTECPEEIIDLFKGALYALDTGLITLGCPVMPPR